MRSQAGWIDHTGCLIDMVVQDGSWELDPYSMYILICEYTIVLCIVFSTINKASKFGLRTTKER